MNLNFLKAMQQLLTKLNEITVKQKFVRNKIKSLIIKLMYNGFRFQLFEHDIFVILQPSESKLLVEELIEIREKKRLFVEENKYFEVSKLRDKENFTVAKIAGIIANGEYYRIINRSIVFLPTLNKYFNNYIHNTITEVERENTKKKKRNFNRINKLSIY